MSRIRTRIVALVLAVTALAACEASAGHTATTTTPPTTSAVDATSSTIVADAPVNDPGTLLDQLTIAAEFPRAGYSRDLFPHWTTTDGCDTRQWVLITESLTDGQIDHRCNIVSGGTWTSLYDGVTGITDPGTLDIDHLVPLAEAWDSGAHAWSTDRRQQFANDLDRDYTLIAVTASSNRQKGDKDPAEWRPSNRDYWCQYATDWIRVKVDWDLTVDPDEHAALSEMLDGCATAQAPTSTVAPTTTMSTTTTAPPPVSTPSGPEPGGCDPNYVPADGSCIPPRHLVGDLNCPDLRPEQKPVQVVGPEDPHRFDLDRNGIGCERT